MAAEALYLLRMRGLMTLGCPPVTVNRIRCATQTPKDILSSRVVACHVLKRMATRLVLRPAIRAANHVSPGSNNPKVAAPKTPAAIAQA